MNHIHPYQHSTNHQVLLFAQGCLRLDQFFAYTYFHLNIKKKKKHDTSDIGGRCRSILWGLRFCCGCSCVITYHARKGSSFHIYGRERLIYSRSADTNARRVAITHTCEPVEFSCRHSRSTVNDIL